MSSTLLLAVLSPFFMLVVVFGVVVIVALTQAKDDDVPTVWRECLHIFAVLVSRMPAVRGGDTGLSDVPSTDVGIHDAEDAEEQ